MVSPAAEQRKRRIIRDLAAARQEILATARGLPPSKRRMLFLGTWSPRHLIAHLIGWDFTNIRASNELLRGRLPSFYRHHDQDWASYNKSLVARYDRGSFEQIVAAAERSHQRLLRTLERIPPSDIIRDRSVRFRGWRVTIERLLAVEASDERTHLKQLRQFARQV